MTDTRGIDRFFDGVDNFLEKLDRGLGGTKQIKGDKRKVERDAKSSSVKRKSDDASRTTSHSNALAPCRFRIDEVTDATSGQVLFIVTDGATARCEFSSRATAERILAQLESSP